MKRLVILSFLWIGFGCDNTFTPEYTLAWEPPVVNQLLIGGNDRSPNPGVEVVFKVWNYQGPFTTANFNEIRNFYISTNPLYVDPNYVSIPFLSVGFEVKEKTNVRLSLMPARFPSESVDEVISRFSNSKLFTMINKGVVIFEGEANGYNKVNDSSILKELPSGMYQLLLETNGEKITRFLYIASNCNEMYPEIRVVIGGCE